MRASELILKKRNGLPLEAEEIDFFIDGYTRGLIPDYQASALAMAVYFRGMNEEETLALTGAMVNSGETLDLGAVPGIKVDKHSTGGVGDTTTLVLVPLVAAAGVPVAKLSGRGLGHTGGTLDKFESIPGFTTEMSAAEFTAAIRDVGVAVAGQSASLVPADRKLYALRDMTATVDSTPLIAASIMSKKLAAGADALVLDVKVGNGAFMKDRACALELARAMVSIGRGGGRRVVALVTAMDQPLGRAVGNALEVKEAISTLRGEGPPDLEELCLILGGWMLYLGKKAETVDEGSRRLRELIRNGFALDKFRELLRNQGGDPAVVDDFAILPRPGQVVEVKADRKGFICRLDAGKIGVAAMIAGAGRETSDSAIDPAAGIYILKKVGDRIAPGETLAEIHAGMALAAETLSRARAIVLEAYAVQGEAPVEPELILEIVE